MTQGRTKAKPGRVNRRSLLLFLVLPGLGSLASSESAFLADPNLDLYHTEESICGITSLYQALRVLGHPIPLEEICSQVPIHRGTASLADMCSFLDALGIDYAVVRDAELSEVLSALRPERMVAVLHVDGGTHFVTAIKVAPGKVRILDGRRVTRDDSEQVAKRRFSGAALLIGEGARRRLLAAHARRVFLVAGPTMLLGFTTRGLLIGSLSVGFLVSILESLCTGQVYLPTIVFMTRAPGMQPAAIGYLLQYNMMFIVPLLTILAMTYFGVRSEALGNILHKPVALAKFGVAGLFAGLAFLVVATLWLRCTPLACESQAQAPADLG